MIRSFSARRGAEEFAAAVDGARPRDEAAADLLELVSALREVEPVEPRPEFSAELRGRLMAEAETALKPQNAKLLLPPREHGRRERRMIAAAAAFVLVGGSTTMAAAAQGSLPGEALYPIKRGIERADTAFSGGAADKGRDQLEQASRRLDEVRSLLRSESVTAPPKVPETLADYSSSASSGASLLFDSFRETGDPATVTAVRTFAADGIATLEALADSVPAEGQDELAAAAALLTDLDQEALALCSSCAEQLPPAEVPGILLAHAEVDRALAQASGYDLANSHPVMVSKEALAEVRRARQRAAEQRQDKRNDAGTNTDQDRSGDEDQPALPGSGSLPSLLPEDDQDSSGDGVTRDSKDTVKKVTKDLEGGLNDVVRTLLPDSDGKSLLEP